MGMLLSEKGIGSHVKAVLEAEEPKNQPQMYVAFWV